MGFTAEFDSLLGSNADKTAFINTMAITSKRSSKETSQTVNINGKEAQILVPDLSDGQKLAVVDQEILWRLIKLLPSVDLSTIKERLCRDITMSKTLEDICGVMVKELNFHKSVNLIETFFMPEESTEKARTVDVSEIHKGQECRFYEDGTVRVPYLYEVLFSENGESKYMYFMDKDRAENFATTVDGVCTTDLALNRRVSIQSINDWSI